MRWLIKIWTRNGETWARVVPNEFMRWWRSERNPWAWERTSSCGGNTGFRTHGQGWRHKYTGRHLWYHRYPHYFGGSLFKVLDEGTGEQ